MSKAYKQISESSDFFITPLHRLNESMQLNERGIRNVAPLAVYVDIIKEVARYYSLPVLDLYAMSGMQPEVDIIRELYMPDGLHPSNAGAEIIAQRLVGFLRTL